MTHSDTTIAGRPARVQSLGRVRSKVGRRFYNLVSVRFLDDGEYHSMGAGEYSRWADRLEREHAKTVLS
jgi:hypothetical protein